jgi:hypothetical protein
MMQIMVAVSKKTLIAFMVIILSIFGTFQILAQECPTVLGNWVLPQEHLSINTSSRLQGLLSSNAANGTYNCVTLYDTIALVGTIRSGLYILDVSNPANPQLLAHYMISDVLLDIAVQNGVAYIAAGWDGLWIVDISNPTQMKEIAHISVSAGINAVLLEGHTLILLGFDILILDVSDPYNPVQLGRFDDVSQVFDAVRVGNFLYVADHDAQRLRVLDISDLYQPKQVAVAWTSTESYLDAIEASGHYLYLAAYMIGLVVFDISDPIHPVEISHNSYSYSTEWLALKGSIAIATDGSIMIIYSISDPLNPTVLNSIYKFDMKKLSIQRNMVAAVGHADVTFFDVSGCTHSRPVEKP